MVLRLKIMLAFVATAVMAVVVSFALAAMVPATLLAALLAMIVAGALAAGFGYMFGGATAQALSDLNNVILRFTKWDMDGIVPHAARADEVGDIAKALKAFQNDAIKWSESHKSEQDSQVQGRLASQQRTEELMHHHGVHLHTAQVGIDRGRVAVLDGLHHCCHEDDFSA